MKRIFVLACFVLGAVQMRAVKVGDTYAEVISEKGKPSNQMEVGATRVLTYSDVTVKIKDDIVVTTTAVAKPKPQNVTTQSDTDSAERMIAGTKKRLKDAIIQVERIVNQEVVAITRSPNMKVASFKEWFHAGATVPDFNHVDIRTTRETPYDKYPFVCSGTKPEIAYVGSDLEFNSMTKYFYTDRSIPKKKLSEHEMLEVNQLYRIIGKCEEQLKNLGVELPK